MSYSWKNTTEEPDNTKTEDSTLDLQTPREQNAPVEATLSEQTNPAKLKPNKKKRKKHKEEKEDGELDDENENIDEPSQTINSQYEDDDYEDYDIDEDSKTSHDDSSKKIEPNDARNDLIPIISLASATESVLSEVNPKEFNNNLNLQPEINQFIPITTQPATHYELDEEEDYDDDDDEYGNSKRLKIDESETIPEETKPEAIQTETDKPKEEATEPKKTEPEHIKTESNQYAEKQLDLDNDNDSSSSMSSKSYASSSALTAISTISSDSLPISSTSSHDSKATNSELQQEINAETVSEPLPDTKMELDEEKLAQIESLKVPPLKIIFNSNATSAGGHPYIKSESDKQTRRIKDKNKKELDSDDLKLEIKSDLDIPANNSRSKASKTNRVSSPVTTTTSAKTTPTRRSAALAGRSSPAQNFTAPQLIKKTDLNSTSLQLTTDLNTTNSVSTNEMENVIRRKLRSHTRQLQTGDVFETKCQLINIKSPSPLTVLNDNVAHFEQDQQQIEQKQEIKGSDHSNDSLIDSSDSATNPNQELGAPARKKRNRQQQQQQPNEPTDLEQQAVVNETVQSSNSSIDSAVSVVSVDQAVATCATQSIVYNCIKKFIDLRNDLNKKRDESMETHFDIKLPKNYNDFTVFKKNYLIKSNKDVRQSISFFKPPSDMPEDLKEYFFKQEKERHSLRLRHRIEQDKLVILYEQEILRCFNNKQQTSTNQTVPFSFCSIVKDDEVYSSYGRFSDPIQIISNSEQQQDDCIDDDKFLQLLENLKYKFQKLKDDMVKRQLNESDSLNAVQKMDFQSFIRELLNKYKINAKNVTANNASTVSASLAAYNLITQFQQTNMASCVPIVHVQFNKIDLFDVAQIYSVPKNSNLQTTTNTISVSS